MPCGGPKEAHFYGTGNLKEMKNSNLFERSTVLSRIRIDGLFLEIMDLGTGSQPLVIYGVLNDSKHTKWS